MMENDGDGLSDRDLRDQAAGKVLDWKAAEHSGSPWDYAAFDPDLRESIVLLAGFAQRQSSLEVMADVIERERDAGTLTKPLASVREVDGLLRDLHGWGTERDALSVSRVGSLLQRSAQVVQTLAAELIAQDRKHARLITPEERQAAKEAIENVLEDEAGFTADDLLRAVLRPIRFQSFDVEEQAQYAAMYGGPAGGSMSGKSGVAVIVDEIDGDCA